MFAKLIEVYPCKGTYALRERTINAEWVVDLWEDSNLQEIIKEGKHIEGLNPECSFTRIRLNLGQGGSELIVTGTLHAIEEKLGLALANKKQLLKG